MASKEEHRGRLSLLIKTAAPNVIGISIGTFGNSATVTVQPSSEQAAAQPTIDAFDWSDAAHETWATSASRTPAVAAVDSPTDPPSKVIRAMAAVLVDEVNILRQWLASFKVEVAAATNLADLKTRVAGLPSTPDRTLAQAKTAVKNKISNGDVDT